MKVTAFNGSPRIKGNTFILLNKVCEQLNSEGITTEIINIGSETLMGCQACGSCKQSANRQCIFNNDPINNWVEKICNSDGILLASPVYFADVSSQTKAFIDRVGYVARANNFLFENKVAAPVIAVRRAGAIPAFNTINNFFFINKMIIPGSSYWNLGIGRDIGDVENDSEGLDNMIDLGQKMSWLIKLINRN